MKDKLPTVRPLAMWLAGLLQVAALVMMKVDPVAHGFGVLTLWVAPIVFMVGLFLPVVGLAHFPSMAQWLKYIQKNAWQSVGFVVSLGVSFSAYLMTLEPTASIWDCSETIAAAYKLQVPHTPGTPLTLLFGRIFAMLAMGNVEQVAWSVNMMSGFFSALAVGVVFLIIWYLGSKLVVSKVALWVGSISGALCLAYSDTFWFSAVEAETYGPSTFCTVLLIWLSLRMEALEATAKRNSVLLISYLTGLSYCIHPMSILVLPVCFVLWRSQRSGTTWKHIALYFAVGMVVIFIISRLIAVHLFEWAFLLDLLLVNQFSLPFYSGVWVLVVFLLSLGIILWKKLPQTRMAILCFALVLAGFSPYLMLFIRSTHMPPINEFVPGDLAKIKPYMNRESYPGRPLLYGPYYDASIVDVSTKAKSYVVDMGEYKEVGEVPQYHYGSNRLTIFPRMYSTDPTHIRSYQQWTGLGQDEPPRFSHNLQFLIHYQLGHMYLRYLLWNFAGRRGDVLHAGWARPWDGCKLSASTGHQRKAFNQYFAIPLVLGLIGMFIQSRKDPLGFGANLVFFLVTGLILAIYLNVTPSEPRERDYIYVGSFVAFGVWIGLGGCWLAEVLGQMKLRPMSWLLVMVPLWMGYQNWDDHNRSNRTFQMDYARAMLESCEKNAVLFTGADNDTFPLWYLQEVEGVRTDVRVMVMSYFNTDWYINQLTRPYYDSPEFDLTLKTGENEYGPYDPVYLQERTRRPIVWSNYLQALNERSPSLMFKNRDSDLFLLPSRKLIIKSSAGDMDLTVSGSYLPKSEMAILDLVLSNDWQRPIYFNYTSINSLKVDLKKYVVQEGLLYRLTPTKHASHEIPLDPDKSYQNLIQQMDYSNLSDPDVYLNFEDYHARMINPLRFALQALIQHYLDAGEKEKALEVAGFTYDKLYRDHLRPSFGAIQLSQLMRAFGRGGESAHLLNGVFEYYMDEVKDQLSRGEAPARHELVMLQEAARLLGDDVVLKEFNELKVLLSE